MEFLKARKTTSPVPTTNSVCLTESRKRLRRAMDILKVLLVFWARCYSQIERSWGNINPKQLRANVDLNLKDRNEIDNEIDMTGRHFLKISTNRSIKFNSNFYSISYPLSVISLYHNTLDFRSSHSLNCFLKLTVELVIIVSYTKNDYLIELITLNVSK